MSSWYKLLVSRVRNYLKLKEIRSAHLGEGLRNRSTSSSGWRARVVPSLATRRSEAVWLPLGKRRRRRLRDLRTRKTMTWTRGGHHHCLPAVGGRSLVWYRRRRKSGSRVGDPRRSTKTWIWSAPSSCEGSSEAVHICRLAYHGSGK